MKSALLIFVLLGAVSPADAQDPSGACIKQLEQNPKLQALWVKYPFDPSKGQSLDVLSNRRKPVASDQAALSYLATEGERCFDLGSDWREANYPAQLNALLATYRVDTLSAMADLYVGKITFGEMAKTRARLTSDLTNQAQTIASNLKAEREREEQRQKEDVEQRAYAEGQARLRQREDAQQRAYAEARARQQQEAVAAQQAELARRQAVLQLLSRPTQIALPPPPKTITTNCWAAGNTVNCESR